MCSPLNIYKSSAHYLYSVATDVGPLRGELINGINRTKHNNNSSSITTATLEQQQQLLPLRQILRNTYVFAQGIPGIFSSAGNMMIN